MIPQLTPYPSQILQHIKFHNLSFKTFQCWDIHKEAYIYHKIIVDNSNPLTFLTDIVCLGIPNP